MKTTMNVAEAKAKLSELLVRVERGEEVAIARAGKVIAHLVAAEQRSRVVPSRSNFFGKLAHLGPVPLDALTPEPMDAWFSEQGIAELEKPLKHVAESAEPFDRQG
jgi:prevent-host-death family protein